MKCRMCKEKEAVIHLKRHKLSVCEKCYMIFFERQVEKGIEQYKMFKSEDKIGICVSGGKDGNVLLYILKKMGYNVVGIHINLGIGEYSKKCKDVVKDFRKKYKVEIKTFDLKNKLGYSLDEIVEKVKIRKRKPCSICSLIKRYLFNKIAFEQNLDVLATGHNMDDEIAFIFSNILKWDLAALSRNKVVLEGKEKLVKKVKPLFRVTDKEVETYAKICGIPFLKEKCPYEKGATSIFYKKVWEIMEKKKPGIKASFYFTFLKNVDKFEVFSENIELRACKICGFPTTSEVCSFCKLIEKISD